MFWRGPTIVVTSHFTLSIKHILVDINIVTFCISNLFGTTSIMILFDLPNHIVSFVLKRYCVLKDLSRFDIAISTSLGCDVYKTILFHTKNDPISISNSFGISIEFLWWLKTRHMHINPNRIWKPSPFYHCQTTGQTLSPISIESDFLKLLLSCETVRLANLVSLQITFLVGLSDDIFVGLLQSIPSGQLTDLNVCGCTALTDISILKVTSHCCGLISVNVSKLKKLTDAVVLVMLSGMKCLTAVNFQGSVTNNVCQQVLLQAFGVMFENCKLKEVNLRHCGGLLHYSTIKFISESASNCGNIVKLVLNSYLGGYNETTDEIVRLCHICPQIVQLSLDDMLCLELRALIHIGQTLKNLQMISCCGIDDCDLAARILCEVFLTFSSVDFAAMRVVGVIRSDFQYLSAELETDVVARTRTSSGRSLSYWKWVGRSMEAFDIHALMQSCSALSSLTIGNWRTLAKYALGPSPQQLALAFAYLTELNFINSNIQEDDVVIFAHACRLTCVSILRLIDCPRIGDRGVQSLVGACSNYLVLIVIDRCHPELSDVWLESVDSRMLLRKISVHKHDERDEESNSRSQN